MVRDIQHWWLIKCYKWIDFSSIRISITRKFGEISLSTVTSISEKSSHKQRALQTLGIYVLTPEQEEPRTEKINAKSETILAFHSVTRRFKREIVKQDHNKLPKIGDLVADITPSCARQMQYNTCWTVRWSYFLHVSLQYFVGKMLIILHYRLNPSLLYNP